MSSNSDEISTERFIVWLLFSLVVIAFVLKGCLSVGLYLYYGQVKDEPILSEYIERHYADTLDELSIKKIDCRQPYSWSGSSSEYKYTAAINDRRLYLGKCYDPSPFQRLVVRKDRGNWVLEASQIEKGQLNARDAQDIVDRVVNDAIFKVKAKAKAKAKAMAEQVENKASWNG